MARRAAKPRLGKGSGGGGRRRKTSPTGGAHLSATARERGERQLGLAGPTERVRGGGGERHGDGSRKRFLDTTRDGELGAMRGQCGGGFCAMDGLERWTIGSHTYLEDDAQDTSAPG